MKNFSKILLSAFALMMLFSLISSVNVSAAEPADQIVDVEGDSIQTQLQNHVRTTFRFRERTQLTICANVEVNLNLDCEAMRIADKDFILEIEGETNLHMNMICTREETQLGLMDGNTYRNRNRNTYRYREGFCISIECEAPCDCQCKCLNECQCICNCECECLNECQCGCDCECECLNECQCICDCECQCQNECQCVCNCGDKETVIRARLRIRATNENRFGKWAYYNENSEEWVIVPTTIEDGYLTAETDHFSTWTVLIPTASSNINMVLIIGSSATIVIIGVIIGSSFLYFKKRR